MRFLTKFPFVAACAIAIIAATSQTARAQVSVDGGYFDTSGNGSVGAAVSLQLFKTPVIPLSVEATAAAPFNGHGFAATADARFRLGGTTIGAGAGAGNIGQSTLGQSRFLYDGIIAQSIAPHLAVEGRVYLGSNRPTSIFAGLRLTL
ncbi:MAG TPA: hypothetical protein VMD07_05700 [Candidatus Acidoferrales bacterium]|nr:hypothetical protein [Candidatus Acidoferrales bacterium]